MTACNNRKTLNRGKRTQKPAAKRTQWACFIDGGVYRLIKLDFNRTEFLHAVQTGQGQALLASCGSLPADLSLMELHIAGITLPALLFIERIHPPKKHARKKPLFTLTPREQDVLQDAVDGLSLKQSARRRNISRSMVSLHRRALKDRLKVESMNEACSRAVHLGLVKPSSSAEIPPEGI